jgi:hypothetical protein
VHRAVGIEAFDERQGHTRGTGNAERGGGVDQEGAALGIDIANGGIIVGGRGMVRFGGHGVRLFNFLILPRKLAQSEGLRQGVPGGLVAGVMQADEWLSREVGY